MRLESNLLTNPHAAPLAPLRPPPHQRPGGRRSLGSSYGPYRGGPSGRDRASLTVSVRPRSSVPFNPAIADSAVPRSAISTKAKLLASPRLNLSLMRATDTTGPNASNAARRSSSVASGERLPTWIFTVSSVGSRLECLPPMLLKENDEPDQRSRRLLHQRHGGRLPLSFEDRLLWPIGADVEGEGSVRRRQPIALLVVAR